MRSDFNNQKTLVLLNVNTLWVPPNNELNVQLIDALKKLQPPPCSSTFTKDDISSLAHPSANQGPQSAKGASSPTPCLGFQPGVHHDTPFAAHVRSVRPQCRGAPRASLPTPCLGLQAGVQQKSAAASIHRALANGRQPRQRPAHASSPKPRPEDRGMAKSIAVAATPSPHAPGFSPGYIDPHPTPDVGSTRPEPDRPERHDDGAVRPRCPRPPHRRTRPGPLEAVRR